MTRFPAKEGLVWFRAALYNARSNAWKWALRAIVLVLGGTLLGLVIGSLFGVLSNLTHAQPTVILPLITQALTGPLLTAFWWFALRDLGDEPRLTKRQWVATVWPAIVWIVGPSLIVWAVLGLVHLKTDTSPGFLMVGDILTRLLSLWPFATVMIGGVFLDRARTGLKTSAFSKAPWVQGWAILRVQWKPLLVAWVLPWVVLSVAFMVLMVIGATVMNMMGFGLQAWINHHALGGWVLRVIMLVVMGSIAIVANLGLVVGYTRVRGVYSAAAVALPTQPTAKATESFPPLA